MPDLTLAESLFYSTMKLTASKGGVPVSTGTGFFMAFAANPFRSFPAIVTNNHVVAGADLITAVCHLAENGQPSGKFVTCNMVIAPGSYISHPNAAVDLCAIPIGDILNQAMDAGSPIFFQHLDQSTIPGDDDWDSFDALQEVTMVGCPNGIFDQVNNLPIARRGITASPLSKCYNGKDEFLVDMACFPGSSGSPVFILDQLGYLNKTTNRFQIGDGRFHFVGILHAGPQITNTGQIVLAQPKVIVPGMMHLGNVIRASALRAINAEFHRLAGILPVPETNVGSVLTANDPPLPTS